MSKFKDYKAQLERAQKVAADLEAIANLDESLAAQTKGNLNKAYESSNAKDRTEESMAKIFVLEERKRLSLSGEE